MTGAPSFRGLTRFTPARVGLGRTGASLTLKEVLAFQWDHAMARDAVHMPLERAMLETRIRALDQSVTWIESAASDRFVYLKRPDLGRRLSQRSRTELEISRPSDFDPDLVIIVADGLSSSAIHHHAVPFLESFVNEIRRERWSLGPIMLAEQARVALGDDVGVALRARAVLVLIGERPGLSSTDSLGAYITLMTGKPPTDADRNCVSNIRTEGLSPPEAAGKIAWLLRAAFAVGAAGVALKDESDLMLVDAGTHRGARPVIDV